ncbi:MAG: hypothetical protein M3Y09_21425, partial [Actinomycetota bacterium]|nr:hypothetical protein [Actinomycetota bacterium]
MRLPREWLGPREELVPVAVEEEQGDTLATPPTAHDFWGEGLSDSWAAPADAAPPGPRRQRHRRRDPHRLDGVSHTRAMSVRGFFRRSSGRTPSIALPGRARSTGRAEPRHLRPSVGLAGAVVLMLLGLAISNGGQAGHVTRSARATHPVTP